MSTTALIGEINHFCVDDGAGIRTTIFFKGCNLSCRWCHNPEYIGLKPELFNDARGARTIGRVMQADEVLKEIYEDIDFYGADGGATFSGGEPMLQADFIKLLCSRLKKDKINTAIDTAGCVNFSEFEKVIDLADTFLYDIKANNAADYKDKCGGDYNLVISNLKKLIALQADVVVRIPIIPAFNNSLDYNLKTADILAEIGVKNVNLLAFHRLGASKYKALNKVYEYANISSVSPESLTALRDIYINTGIKTKIIK